MNEGSGRETEGDESRERDEHRAFVLSVHARVIGREVLYSAEPVWVISGVTPTC